MSNPQPERPSSMLSQFGRPTIAEAAQNIEYAFQAINTQQVNAHYKVSAAIPEINTGLVFPEAHVAYKTYLDLGIIFDSERKNFAYDRNIEIRKLFPDINYGNASEQVVRDIMVELMSKSKTANELTRTEVEDLAKEWVHGITQIGEEVYGLGDQLFQRIRNNFDLAKKQISTKHSEVLIEKIYHEAFSDIVSKLLDVNNGIIKVEIEKYEVCRRLNKAIMSLGNEAFLTDEAEVSKDKTGKFKLPPRVVQVLRNLPLIGNGFREQ